MTTTELDDLDRQAEGMLAFVTVVMDREDVEHGEAVRRLLAYGEVVYRTVRLQRGRVVLRSSEDVESALVIDELGNPVEHDMVALVWMRPRWSTVACAFLGVDVAAGLRVLEPVRRCDRWPVADLLQDTTAERCPACLRATNQGSR